MPTTDPQQLLLRAALAAEGSSAAWQAWRQQHEIEVLEGETAELVPLIHKNLEDDPEQAERGLAESDRSRLRGVFKFHWSKHQTAGQRLATVLDCLSTAGISCALQRETAMAFTGPYAPGTRPIRRLDLLIRVEDLAAANHTLLAAGWTAPRPLPANALLSFLPGMPFLHGNGQRLFLLWHPAGVPAGGDRGAGLWQRLGKDKICDKPVRSPNRTDLLLLACLHAVHAGPTGPEPLAIVDMVRLIAASNPPVDWHRLWTRSLEIDRGEEISLALVRLQEVVQGLGLKANIPQALLPARQMSKTVRQLPPATLSDHWAHYKAACPTREKRGVPIGFFSYLITAHRWYWQVPHLSQMPAALLRRAIAKHTASESASDRR